jgi:hypothetical protein
VSSHNEVRLAAYCPNVSERVVAGISSVLGQSGGRACCRCPVSIGVSLSRESGMLLPRESRRDCPCRSQCRRRCRLVSWESSCCALSGSQPAAPVAVSCRFLVSLVTGVLSRESVSRRAWCPVNRRGGPPVVRSPVLGDRWCAELAPRLTSSSRRVSDCYCGPPPWSSSVVPMCLMPGCPPPRSVVVLSCTVIDLLPPRLSSSRCSSLRLFRWSSMTVPCSLRAPLSAVDYRSLALTLGESLW